MFRAESMTHAERGACQHAGFFSSRFVGVHTKKVEHVTPGHEAAFAFLKTALA
jgi:hypothetical protein